MRNPESKWFALAVFIAAYLLFPCFPQVKRAMAGALPPLAVHAHSHDRDYPVQDEETVRKSFPLAGGAAQPSLAIDNVFGSIEVKGTEGNAVELVVKKTLRAATKAKLELARKEVTLDTTEQPGSLKFYVNGPFRCQCEDGCNGSHWDEPGYMVIWDFELRVPRKMDLDLRTVNSGDIRVADVTGAYSVRNVNGKIEMTNVGGSGKAHTVNGSVKVTFRENPRESSSFASREPPAPC